MLESNSMKEVNRWIFSKNKDKKHWAKNWWQLESLFPILSHWESLNWISSSNLGLNPRNGKHTLLVSMTSWAATTRISAKFQINQPFKYSILILLPRVKPLNLTMIYFLINPQLSAKLLKQHALCEASLECRMNAQLKDQEVRPDK